MAIQVSARLNYPQAAALLNMMETDNPREVLDKAIDRPDTDIPAGRPKSTVVRYFSHTTDFTVTFR
jgi:hypothetical protein